MKFWLYAIGGPALVQLSVLMRKDLMAIDPVGFWQTANWFMRAAEMLVFGLFGIILLVLALKILLTGEHPDNRKK